MSTAAKNAARTAYRFFVGQDLGEVGAAALVGNFLVESIWRLDPTLSLLQIGAHRGIAQWDYETNGSGRWNKFIAWAGRANPYTLNIQLQWAMEELNHNSLYIPTRNYLKSLRHYADVTAGASYVQAHYEVAVGQGTFQREYEARLVLRTFAS